MSGTPYTCSLSSEDLDKAKKELNEDPDTRKLEVQTLRERLLRYPGLKPRTDDAFLLKFLRPRKFDQERAFTLIINYYRMKKDNEDMYAEMTPKHIQHCLDADIISHLPQKGKNGEAIIIWRTEGWDPARQPIEDIFKSSFIINSHIVECESAQVNGVRYISDLEGMTWTHATAMSPSMAQKMAHMIQDAFPMRVKGIHYVNQPSVFDYVFAMIKPFLKEKLTSRLHFHGSKHEELHDFIHPDHLPEKYGGKLPHSHLKESSQKILEKQSQYEDDAKYGFVSMDIQQKSKKTADAMENLPGTFKKLNVD